MHRETASHGERLLIRTIRLLAVDPVCHSLGCQFEHAVGLSGREAFQVLEVFVSQLRVRGLRRITLSVPMDPRLTRDECLMIDAFAAAQIDDYRTLDARLARLVGISPPPALGAAVCLVAQHFAMSGLWLTGDGADDQVWAVSTTPTSTAVQCVAAAATT